MGTKSKSDISNSAIRMLLQEAGSFYDEARGFKKFNTKSTEWKEVLALFSNSCCYCGVALTEDNVTNDHLVPINKTALGLHAWGNIVPCCQRCNKEKHFGDWRVFIKKKSGEQFYKKRAAIIRKFQKKFKYNPNLSLKDVANNLYQDVGEVSSVLVNLRLKQAQVIIQNLLGTRSKK
ncbi:MAG: HNH endonuclease signature motif containing protein [bacterium]|nr:HNH endonuclease signature motif containing protein [bacterium]